ncbi:hypothetical protein D1831_09655 [Lactiplantibacillus garii]|uniref:Uncharacterized protein n=1 Tax=Lactiplantibacillus garii TaxID=2306423 RepID=A0A3R8J703_9LACO|nr:hypothetical protein [Lactiplantibacillus garii]RRK10013.1 hypothetical protein D1831_09655 [Lactiplantibacillus garii]
MSEESKTKTEADLFNDTTMYCDIMDRPRPEPKAHLRMPRGERAAQFAPFAALTGYQDLIEKRAKVYAHKQYPTAAQVNVVTAQLRRLQRGNHHVEVNYFNDEVGLYQTITAALLAVDFDRGLIRLSDRLIIAIANVRRIVSAQTNIES